MALELRSAGPAFDAVRRLDEGQRALVLGRDAQCGIRRPDPQCNVSRRHLWVRVEAGELHFHVLSGTKEHAAGTPGWAQRLLDRHFTESCVREILRMRRETRGTRR